MMTEQQAVKKVVGVYEHTCGMCDKIMTPSEKAIYRNNKLTCEDCIDRLEEGQHRMGIQNPDDII